MVRSFKDYHDRDPSHPDGPGSADIGEQPTLGIPDYSGPAYDCAVDGLPPFYHFPTYDW